LKFVDIYKRSERLKLIVWRMLPIQEIGEIEADSMEDAALLLKYGHGPKMWKQESTSMRLVDPGNKMIRNIDDYKS
jgi:hypothetical protein